MARKKMWFGVPGAHMQWVPAPSAGLTREEIRYTDQLELMNGKLASKRSNPAHVRFELDFPVQPSGGLDGLDVFSKFAAGFYGDGATGGKVMFSDPYAQNNLFPPEWATPGLWVSGWPPIGDFPNITTNSSIDNSYGRPPINVHYSIQPGAPRKRCIIPVPPGYVLLWGASGPSGQPTTTTRVRARPMNRRGIIGTGASLFAGDLFSPIGPVRTGGYFGGTPNPLVDLVGDEENCVAAVFDLYTVSGGAISLNSMFARLVPIARSSDGSWPAIPPITGDHQHGQGHHPLSFTDNAMPYTYEYITGRLKGLSTVLEETL